MRADSENRLRGLTPDQRGLVGSELSLFPLCVHVDQRLQCGKIREQTDAGLGSLMAYVQVRRPQPPWHTEQVDPLDFLSIQLRLLGQAAEEAGGGQQLAQFSRVHGMSSLFIPRRDGGRPSPPPSRT